MAVSIGGGFTGKPHHELSLFLLSVSFLQPHSYFLLFFMKKICRFCSGTFCNLCKKIAQYTTKTGDYGRSTAAK